MALPQERADQLVSLPGAGLEPARGVAPSRDFKSLVSTEFHHPGCVEPGPEDTTPEPNRWQAAQETNRFPDFLSSPQKSREKPVGCGKAPGA